MCLTISSVSVDFCFWSKLEGDDSVSVTLFATLERNFSSSNLSLSVARFDLRSPILRLCCFFNKISHAK
ncbi:hypothetical protein HanIR_Chr06g0280541 [Helianthus annuus]|nr:hypothetical protein HanIR_Chr06g0280541 [Helianthus annuus]